MLFCACFFLLFFMSLSALQNESGKDLRNNKLIKSGLSIELTYNLPQHQYMHKKDPWNQHIQNICVLQNKQYHFLSIPKSAL